MTAARRPPAPALDAIVVGAGPNGLAAAVTLARAGLRVRVYEAQPAIGGGARTAELTLPGFLHDVGSAVHPFGIASPVFRSLPLHAFGLEWVHPAAPFAHPLDDGAVLQERGLDATAERLGGDARRYLALMRPLVDGWEDLLDDILKPLLGVPRHPLTLARFGPRGLPPASLLARAVFREEPARALLAGLAAHTNLPLGAPGTSAAALVLGLLGHAVGWPVPRGGAGEITRALADYLRFLGGEVVVDTPVTSLGALPPARAVLLDLTPRALLRLAGDRLPPWYRGWLERYRLGPGVFKLDYALSGPVPWRDPHVARAVTVHVGGPLKEIEASEREVAAGRHPERPYVLLAQPSLFDPTRAPAGKHTLWAYCHVPNGSDVDMTALIEAQIERFAPGFRDLVLARAASGPAALEAGNANLIGGDVSNGAPDLWQLVARPLPTFTPYRTPLPGLYLCSAATPPGLGVHGMAGFHAARAALKDVFGLPNVAP